MSFQCFTRAATQLFGGVELIDLGFRYCMPQRNALKGVVHGLIGTFTSRYNDVNGYWGIGFLRLIAVERKVVSLTLDLLNPDSSGPYAAQLEEIAGNYQLWLSATLPRFGYSLENLTSATIEIRFSSFKEFPNAIRDTRGEPYEVSVKIRRFDGKVYEAAKIGVCEIHNPSRESQSGRINDI